jgi:hypothetical protein
MTEMDATRNSLKEYLSELITSQNLSQAQIAREVGISGAALSGFLKGTYAGDSKAIDKKLHQWMTTRTRQASCLNGRDNPHEWVNTDTSNKILPALEYAHMAGDITVVYGGSGVGKTESLKHYAGEHPNVWIATMTPAHAGVSPSLEEIAFALDMRDVPGRSARLMREIIRRLRDTRGLLIIDEAQHLLPAALEAIRSIHDAAGMGLVLCGNESVYSRLSGGKRSAVFAQLYSRVGKRLRITGILKNDVVKVATAFEIFGKKEQRTLWDIGKKPGGLRGVVKTLRLAYVFALGNGTKVDDSMIRAAWMDLAGESME